jgi:hypothetical protein
VSDHGYGHATRTIALVRDVLALGEFEIIIRNSNAFKLMRNVLTGCDVRDARTDVGPIVNVKSNKLDTNSTFDSFSKWLGNEREWISKEISDVVSNHSPDLIVTDISPMALKLAKKIGCPCATVANFSWIDLLEPLPHHKEKENVLEWLSESFAIPDLVIRLPFSMNMKGFRSSGIKKASLLYRKPTMSIDETVREIGETDKPLIVVSFGGRIPIHLDFDIGDAKVVLLSPAPIEINDRMQVIVGHPESQNIIRAADFIIAKAGYSTLAECVAFRCPLDIITREGYPEDTVLVKEVSALGIGSQVRKSDYYYIKVPDIDGISERKRAIKNNRIRELERFQSASELILDLL